MAVTNHERVGKGLELLRAGLGPFVERELKQAVQAGNLSGYRRKEIADDPMFLRPVFRVGRGGGTAADLG